MKRIIIDKTPFLVDLSTTDTANYAQEEVVLDIRDGANEIMLPPQSKIAGNPNINLWYNTKNDLTTTINFAAGEGVPVTTSLSPTGRLGSLGFTIIQAEYHPLILAIKPLLDGIWALNAIGKL